MALNKNGFTRKTYSDLLDEMEAKFIELFGADVNLSAYTPLGIIMRVMAFFYAKLWDGLEAVYNSRFIKKADGVSLNYHGGDKNLPRNPATHSYVDVEIEGQPGYIVMAGEQAQTEGGIIFEFQDDVEIKEDGKAKAELISIERGAFNNISSNAITKMVEPVNEITSITNPSPAVGGMDIETNTSYRNRLLKSNEARGKAIPNAITVALLNTPGVRTANVIYNNKNEPDDDGNPPKSVHAYVLGGEKEAIAQTLLDAVAGGIETVGERVSTVLDVSGNEHIIKFDYAEIFPIYMRLTYSKSNEFEADGEKQLKDAMINKIGGIDADGEEIPGLSMGESIVVSQLYSSAFKVAGVQDVTIEIGIESDSLAVANIPVARNQIANLSFSNIEVIESA